MQPSSGDAERPLPEASTVPQDLCTGAAGSGQGKAPSAIRFAVPAASCADKIERQAEKRLFWQLAAQPEFRCGSSLDYTRMAAAFNQEAADQHCAVYSKKRSPPHEQDALRFIDAQRLRDFHENVLRASAAVPAGKVSEAVTAPAPLQSSSPASAADVRLEHLIAQLLGAMTGGTASNSFMEDSSAAEALAALQQAGIADSSGVQPGVDVSDMPPQEVARPCSAASMGVSIPQADAAAAAAAQAASRQVQRHAELMRCIQPAPQLSGPRSPADTEAAPLPQQSGPHSSAALQQLPAQQPHANPALQRKRVLLAVVAVLLANFSAMLASQMTSRRALGHSPGARAVMANTASMSGTTTAMMTAAAGMLHAPAKNQGGAGVAKKCRLCQQPRRGTHQHGCPSHCKECKQPHAACSCGA